MATPPNYESHPFPPFCFSKSSVERRHHLHPVANNFLIVDIAIIANYNARKYTITYDAHIADEYFFAQEKQ
jgi:hypothetical protein